MQAIESKDHEPRTAVNLFTGNKVLSDSDDDNSIAAENDYQDDGTTRLVLFQPSNKSKCIVIFSHQSGQGNHSDGGKILQGLSAVETCYWAL